MLDLLFPGYRLPQRKRRHKEMYASVSYGICHSTHPLYTALLGIIQGREVERSSCEVRIMILIGLFCGS